MIKILFVCHGNVCRSPMAEFIMKDLVKENGKKADFLICSAATHTEVIGNHVHPPAAKRLAECGIDCSEKTACQLKRSDLEEFDLVIGMDHSNLDDIFQLYGEAASGKQHLLLDFTDHPGDIADPYYTHDFETTWHEISAGCQGLLQWLNRLQL